MKIQLLIFVSSFVLLAFQSGRPMDLSGKWSLDLKKSKNLPEAFKHVDTFVLEVRQSRDSIVTSAQMKGNGQDVNLPLTTYALNGSEVFREDTIRKSKRWITCAWDSSGKKFVVDSRVEQHRGPTPSEYSQRDVWEIVEKNMLQISVLQKNLDGKEIHSERRILHRIN